MALTARYRVLARFHFANGNHLGTSGDMMNAIAQFEVAVVAAEQAGDVRTASGIRANASFYLIELGELERAEGLLLQVLAEAKKASLASMEPAALQALGSVFTCLGRFEEARNILTRALELAEQQGNWWISGRARVYLSTLEYASGNLIESERQKSTGSDVFLDAPQSRPAGLPPASAMARALLSLGRKEEAFILAQEAMTILDSLGSVFFSGHSCG